MFHGIYIQDRKELGIFHENLKMYLRLSKSLYSLTITILHEVPSQYKNYAYSNNATVGNRQVG